MASRSPKRPARRTTKPAGDAAPASRSTKRPTRQTAEQASQSTPADELAAQPAAETAPETLPEPAAEPVVGEQSATAATATERAASAPTAHDEPFAAHAADAWFASSPQPAVRVRTRRVTSRISRRRMLPFSERSVLAASLLLVLLSTPLWLDPSALYELGWGGRPSPSVMPATTPPGPAPASPATPGVVGAVVASDTFSRRSASGWGRAEIGGRYTVEGSLAGLAVEPGVGVIQLADGDAGSVVLLGVSVADASLELSFALDGLPREGELRLVAELRRNERGGGYRPAIAIGSDGAVIVGAGLRLGGTEQELSTSYVVPDLTVADGDALRLRAEAIGSDPTTIRLRVWPADEPEPGFWHVSVIDWSGALQGAGALGLGWWLDSTPSRPLTVRIDDLTLTTIVAGESQ